MSFRVVRTHARYGCASSRFPTPLIVAIFQVLSHPPICLQTSPKSMLFIMTLVLHWYIHKTTLLFVLSFPVRSAPYCSIIVSPEPPLWYVRSAELVSSVLHAHLGNVGPATLISQPELVLEIEINGCRAKQDSDPAIKRR